MDAPGSGSGSNTNACATLPSFGAVTKYSAANSIAFAVGDVDRDGKKDAVVVTRTSSSGDVVIYPGIQGGGFGASHPLRGTATLATGVLIADVDADGSNDIVTWEGQSPIGTQGTFSVSVHRQNMTPNEGTFATPQTFSFAAQTTLKGVVAGNLNGDTRTDLVVQTFAQVNGMDETYPYLASTSTAGAYTKGTLIASGMTASHVLDVDGDGYDDVVFTRMTGGLGIYFNSATTPGTFTAAAVGAGSAENAVFGRFKSTTRMDLFLWGSGSPTPKDGVLYEQTSSRVFVQRSTVIDNVNTDSVHAPGEGILTVDINADGRHDVVGMDGAEIQCPTMGTFWPTQSAQADIRFGDPLKPTIVRQFTDINGGGKPDLIALDGDPGIASNFLEVWLQ